MHIDIDLTQQRLRLLEGERELKSYPVATAANGPGEQMGSHCTPRGRHVIRAKIGAGAPVNTVFVGRRPSGEIYSPALEKQHPGRDWILTRILWLGGCEPGGNRFGAVDSMRRYIYIHGARETAIMGEPSSHGCVNMRNADVIELFDRVRSGTEVCLHE
jgi:lipoprotein-anchoring transpeptidase ErfK/SrfK